MKKYILTLGAVMLLAMAASAATYNGVVTIDTATDEGGGETTIGSSGTGNVTTITSTGSLYNSNGYNIGYGWAGEIAGTLVVQGEVGSDSARVAIQISRGVATAAGTLVVDGGNVYGSYLYAGRVANTATITVNSGLFDCNGAIHFGYVDGAQVAYTQTGGTANLGLSYQAIAIAGRTDSVATAIISGGTLNLLGDVTLGAGSGSTCRVEVQGSAATIVASRTWTNTSATTTLAFVLDDSTNHITTIEAAHVVGGATVDIDLNGYTPNQNDVFDLFTDNDGAFPDISGYTLAAEDVGTWELKLSDDNSTLQAIYLVPEPTTMALLAVGGMAILRRNRRKA